MTRALSLLMTGALLATATMPVSAASSRAEKGEAELAKAIDGRTAGKPVDCIYLRDIQSTEIIDGTAIIYRISSNKLYVNRPRGGQDRLDWGVIMVTDTHGPQLCSIDIVKLIDSGSHFYAGFVDLGEFVPYTKTPPAAR